jgi:exodeoxyribonuclease V alpha subunit
LAEKTPFRTEQLRLENGERFVLTVAADGMPVWWPNLYCQIAIRERGISFSAMHAHMSAICVFHNLCGNLGIDVDARIEHTGHPRRGLDGGPAVAALVASQDAARRPALARRRRTAASPRVGLLFHRFVEDPVVTSTLTTVHRQAAATSIPGVAAQIRRREMPNLSPYVLPHKGVMLDRVAGREQIADRVVSIWNDFGEDRDVIIVTPVNDCPCGVAGLNRRLHDEYLRKKDLQELRGPLGDLFSPGEPVIHRRNCYKRGLFNGSMGTVRRIDRAERQLMAVFDGEEHVFASEDLVDLSLGYALTCHRAQGSEADYVIVALPPSRLLDPSWLYTAVTRARQQVVIVGQPETIQEALQRPYADERRSVGLQWFHSTSSGAAQ